MLGGTRIFCQRDRSRHHVQVDVIASQSPRVQYKYPRLATAHVCFGSRCTTAVALLRRGKKERPVLLARKCHTLTSQSHILIRILMIMDQSTHPLQHSEPVDPTLSQEFLGKSSQQQLDELQAQALWDVHGVFLESIISYEVHALLPFSGMGCIAVASLLWLGSAPSRV